MSKISFALTLAILCTGLVACASKPASEDDAFNRLAGQADKEIAQAEKLGFLWRDTETLLAEARKANKEGRHDDAMKLAQQTLKQAQLAQQQAQSNANAGPSYAQ
jgi:hypothetical protein